MNLSWLRKSKVSFLDFFSLGFDAMVGQKVGLIVDTAGGLESTLGPKYTKALQRRATELPEVTFVTFVSYI